MPPSKIGTLREFLATPENFARFVQTANSKNGTLQLALDREASLNGVTVGTVTMLQREDAKLRNALSADRGDIEFGSDEEVSGYIVTGYIRNDNDNSASQGAYSSLDSDVRTLNTGQSAKPASVESRPAETRPDGSWSSPYPDPMTAYQGYNDSVYYSGYGQYPTETAQDEGQAGYVAEHTGDRDCKCQICQHTELGKYGSRHNVSASDRYGTSEMTGGIGSSGGNMNGGQDLLLVHQYRCECGMCIREAY